MAANAVNIPITATNRTQQAFASVNKSLKNLKDSSMRVAASVGRVGVVAAGVAAGALVALTRRSMESADALAKTADKIGITTEALAGLQYAGELTGVSTQTMNMALQRMTRRVAEAARGTGEAKGALQELGLNAQKLQKLPLDVQMQVIADAMGKVENQSDRVRLAMKLFDSEGVSLVNTLAGGSDGLKQMASEAQRLGLAMSRVDTAMIEKANDDITRAQSVFTGLGNQLATSFAPIIQGVSTAFYQAALDSAEFGNTGQRAANGVIKAVGFVANGVRGLQAAFHLVRGAVALMGSYITKAFSEIAKGIDYVIDKYNAVARFFGKPEITTSLSEMWGGVSDSLQQVADDAFATAEALATATLPSDEIQQWYESVQAGARKTAEVVAANAPGLALTGNGDATQPPIISDKLSADFDTAITLANDFTNAIATAFDSFGASLTESQEKTVGAFATIGALTMMQMQTLSNAFGEGSAAAKAFYLVNQAMAASMAIVNGFQAGTAIRLAYAQLAAATANPGLAVAGEMHAKLAEGMGFVSAAAIMGQTVASFEGGGFTGYGARAGGLDGKGGYMAMVHPNESIIDHTKGGSASAKPVNVSLNIQAVDARGVDQLLMERRGMITSMVTKALANSGRTL